MALMRTVIVKIAILLLLLLFISVAGYGYWQLTTPHAPQEPRVLQVAPGASLIAVANDLHRHGVIRHALLLRILAKWHDQEQRIQAGQYSFSVPATPQQILERLVRGDVDRVSLTIPEGFTLRQIAHRIEEAGYGSAQRILQLAQDNNFVAGLAVEAETLEGYLFPETYRFVPGTTETALLTMMVDQFRSRLTPDLRDAARQRGLTVHQHVTLASLIEKETGLVSEMPLVSSVFHNRLAINMRLQTDPTVVYGLEDFTGTITRRHLSTPTPYNTYIIYGLPPGPIASPGLAALTAAVYPAESDFYYFVSRGDGSHHFSRNLREHNNAVQRYLRGRR